MDNEYRDRIVIHCSDGDIPKLAYCGEKVTWTLENGTLTISGTGEMFDYDSGQNKAPWVDDASKITNVMIDDGVTSIGEYAFLNCKSLETITIPGSVTSVGFCAFEDCTSLTGITYNGTIKQLCEVSFDGENVEMQSKVIHCNDGDISYGISWTLEDGTLTVSGLGHLAYYDGIENPWENMRDEIKTVIIKSGVKSIGAGTFESCVNLTDVTIADTVTTIENRAFSGCKKLKSLNIPGSVRDIGNAFDGCTILTDIYYGGTAAQWKSALWENATSVCSFTIHCTDEVVLPGGTCGDSVKWALKDGTLTISGTGEMNYNTRYVPWHNNAETIKTVEIEDGITYIGSSAFLDCTNLENITIPSSVTGIGNSVFDNCTSLTDITYTGTIEQFRNMSFGEYNNGLRSKVIHCTDGDITYGISWTLEDGVLTVSGMGGMEPYDEGEAPWNDERDSIKSIVIKDGVTSINCNAFYSCRNVTDVTIADSVTVIEQGAFSYCESLKSLNISVNVTDVCDAFGGCTNLTDIYYGGTAAQWENALWDSPRSVKCITIHCTDKDILPGGTCGDNVTWTLQNNTLTISGAGDIEDYLGYSYTPWYSKSKVITSVVIDSGVTGIGTYAFSYFFSIQSISIPKSVTKIGGHAFEYCQELNDVVIPDGVTSIEESTFEHCYRLESITIPAGVTSIGEYAFYGCESLTKIQFGGTIAQWEALLGNADSSALRNACVYCSDGKITIHGTCGTNLTWELDNGVLTISGTGDMENYLQDDEGAPWSEYSGNIKSIVIKNGVTSIGNNAFANCYNAAAVTIPDSVKAIGSSAFDSCSKLKQISIPGGVREIKYGTFRYCTGLENIVIPDGIELIDEYAFSNCTSLKSVNIPAAVTELYTSAFDHCDSLSGIDVDENNSYFSSVDGVLFSKSKSTLLCCPSGMETDSYQIPDYVTSLAGGAFKYCSGLTSITVPDSVRSMGGYAFAGCKNIKEITLPGEIDEISDGMFWGCESLMSIVVPDGVQRIGDSAFYQCYALSSVSIPDSVQSIGWDAFYYCGSLTSIELPSGLESINDSTFSHCGALESITIPNTVKSICERAFSNCSALKDIYFNGSADEWLEIEVSEYNDQLRSATVHCTDRNVTPEEFEVAWTLENGVLTISGKWEIKNYGREEAPWYSESESITSVVVKDGVKRVGNNAFYGCSNLESVTLGDSVKSIGDYAFGGCSNLKTITIPAGLTSISYSAFGGCYALTTVNYAGTLSYHWDFGDGTSSDEIKPIKKFKQLGVFTVKLTVTDTDGVVSSDTLEVTVNERSAVGTVKVNVVDENGKPVANAPVYFDLGANTQKKINTDKNGAASMLMSKGDHEIGVYKNGYLPVQKTVTVLPNATRIITVTVIQQELVTGEFEVKRMTFNEIKAAGIDVDDPANQNVYKVNVTIRYGDSEIPVTYIRNNFAILNYTIGKSGGDSGDNSGDGSGDGSGSNGRDIAGLTFIGNSENVEIIAVLDMPIEASYLKEFFDVRLHIINNAAQQFKLTDSKVHLDVPEGMTMMTGVSGDWSQSTDVNIGTINGQETKTLAWILRGDKEGSYDLEADYSGTLAA